jgi:predicted PurR-regulated permease PerM
MITEPRKLPLGAYWFALALILLFLVWVLGSALTPFVAAMAIAYLLDPLADRLERMGLSRVAATTVIMVSFFSAVILVLIIIVPIIEGQVVAFAGSVPGLLSSAEEAVIRVGGPRLQELLRDPQSSMSAPVGDLAKSALQWGGGVLRSIWTGGVAIVGLVGVFIIAPVVSCYLLLDWDRLVQRIDSWLPRDQAPTIRMLAKEIDRVLAGFVRGQLSVCFLLAIYYATGLSLTGLQFGLLVGAMTGMLSFIPMVGSIMGIASAALIGTYQFWPDLMPLALIGGVFVGGQILEGYVLTPRIVGNSIGLHPVWLMFALFAFGNLFGLLGLLLAVPVSAALGVLLRYGLTRYLASPLYLGRSGGDNLIPPPSGP